jgi:tetratricopeptide (TPR) repeat protein
MRSRAKHRATGAEAAHDADAELPRPQSRGWLLVAAALAAVLAVAVWFNWPPRQPAENPASGGAAAGATSTIPQPAEAAGDRPPGPTIRLAAAPLPLDAEALARETEEVGRQLLARYPNLPEALHAAALAHAQLRQSAQAEKLWRQCIVLDSHSERYRVNLAVVAMERGDNELAVQVLEPAAAQSGASPDVTLHLGLALTNLGRTEEAERLLVAAVQDHPRSATHWLVLGQAQLALGKASDAETSLRQALALGLDSADLYFALGNACAQQGKADQAAAAREEFARRKESQPLSAQERFTVLTLAEARNTAVAVMLEAATVHAWQQDSLESERLLLRAIAIQPGSLAACQKLADVYQQAGLAAEERAVVERLVQLEPLNLAHYLELARLADQLGEPESAEAALKLAISVAPDNAAPYTTLARYYVEQQKPQKARWYAQEAVRRAPTADGFLLLASTCRLTGDAATAEDAMAEARRLQNAEPTPRKPPP